MFNFEQFQKMSPAEREKEKTDRQEKLAEKKAAILKLYEKSNEQNETIRIAYELTADIETLDYNSFLKKHLPDVLLENLSASADEAKDYLKKLIPYWQQEVLTEKFDGSFLTMVVEENMKAVMEREAQEKQAYAKALTELKNKLEVGEVTPNIIQELAQKTGKTELAILLDIIGDRRVLEGPYRNILRELSSVDPQSSTPPTEQMKTQAAYEAIERYQKAVFHNNQTASQPSTFQPQSSQLPPTSSPQTGAPPQQPTPPMETPTEEKNSPTRATAWHTIRKFQDLPADANRTYDELNAVTPEERIEKFKKLSRELWNEFTVHGFAKFDKTTGSWHVEQTSDLDGRSCLKLMELAGMDLSNVKFVQQGGTADSGIIMDTSEKHGVIAEESGKRVTFDHHGKQSGRDTSATKFVYKTLVKLKFFDKDQQTYLDKYVKFVTNYDNLDFGSDEKSIYTNYHENLYGMASNMSATDVLELIKQGVDPMASLPKDYLESHTYINPGNGQKETLTKYSNFIKSQKFFGEKEVPKLAQKGFVLDTGIKRFGKVLIDTMKKAGKNLWFNKINGVSVTRQLTAFQKGYGAYVVWSPQENKFFVFTQNKMDDTSIPGGFSQGKNIRGHMLISGSMDTKPVKPEFLEEILGKLSGKKDFKIEGKLKKALELDAKGKEMLDLFDENRLTENDLRETSGKMGILLKDLLEAMLSQRDKLNKELEKVLAKKPKPDRNRITVDFLLEQQGKTIANSAPLAPSITPQQPQAPPQQPPTLYETQDMEKEKQERISNSIRDLSDLFSNFELSREIIIQKADEIKVRPSELALKFIKSTGKLKMYFDLRLNSIFPASERTNNKTIEKIALTIILEDEKRKVEEKIKKEGESDMLNMKLIEIESELLAIKRITNL
jgi:hypothetical protein